MSGILVLYPCQFSSREKFKRKVSRITKNIPNAEFICPNDHNSLLESYAREVVTASVTLDAAWSLDDVKYAIIFDDGEEFVEETARLVANDIPTRSIFIRITRVINIKRDSVHRCKRNSKDYEYIGRGSYWGNPYSMFEDGNNREEVIRKYAYDFSYDKFPNKKKSSVFNLAGKRLGCYCKPQSCHGDVLADFLNSWDDGL